MIFGHFVRSFHIFSNVSPRSIVGLMFLSCRAWCVAFVPLLCLSIYFERCLPFHLVGVPLASFDSSVLPPTKKMQRFRGSASSSSSAAAAPSMATSPQARSTAGRTRNITANGGSNVSKASAKAPLFAYYSLTAVCLLFVLIRQAPELFVLSDVASLKYMNDVQLGALQNAPVAKVFYNETYTPKLLSADDFVKFNGIHIVRSRYQQGQPDLVTLGKARLRLFKDFCLPSMVHQTTDNFVWLIYTDPNLNQELLKEMVDLLAPYPHFYLIASMVNVLWKDGQAQNLTQSVVYTGNRTFLEETMAKRDVVPILETRLDADDALHVRYLEDIQKEAADMFYRQGVRWMYWCIEEELQWYWAGHKGVTEQQKKSGLTLSRTNKDFCPTPGLTLGYNVGTEVSSIYRRKHSILIERIRKKEEDLCFFMKCENKEYNTIIQDIILGNLVSNIREPCNLPCINLGSKCIIKIVTINIILIYNRNFTIIIL